MMFLLLGILLAKLFHPSIATLEELSTNLIEQLNYTQIPLVDFTSYPGVNYECATAMIPLGSDPFISYTNDIVSGLLEQGREFPHPFYWVKRGYPVSWLYSPGDRIGLFGALYRNHDDDVYCYVKEYTRTKWPRHRGLFTRNLGYGPLLGLQLTGYNMIWADDIFIGGYALLLDHPDQIQQMIDSAVEILKDPSDGLWWHGVKVSYDGDGEYSYQPNGVKWGRAHGWILLMIANYVTRTNKYVDFLELEINTARAYQRPSGAFGNIVDDDSSPDETSLTSVYVYAVGVLHTHGDGAASPEVLESARRAIDWLDERQVTSIHWSDSAKGMHLKQDSELYNKVVSDEATGPVVALALWARVGQSLIEFPNKTQQFEPWLHHPAPQCVNQLEYSGVFYFLSILACITFMAMIAFCCFKCSCCRKCRSRCCPCCYRSKNGTFEENQKSAVEEPEGDGHPKEVPVVKEFVAGEPSEGVQ